MKYTACAMCPAECGLEMWTQDGKLSKVYGNKEVPLNDGITCAKGAAIPQLVYSPYRLKYPMIRVGERGLGKFKRVTWGEAIEHIGKKLTDIKKKYGAESIIMDTGDVTDRDQYWRLFFAYGSPNCSEHGSICDTPRRHGPKLMLGGKRIEPDIMRPVLVRQPDGSLKEGLFLQDQAHYLQWLEPICGYPDLLREPGHGRSPGGKRLQGRRDRPQP